MTSTRPPPISGDGVGSRVEADTRSLLRRIWGGVVANRGLVIAIIAIGAVQAIFTKAPLLLIKPILRVLAETRPAGPEPLVPGFWSRIRYWLEGGFEEFSEAFVGWLGLGIEDPRLAVLFTCAVIASVAGLIGGYATYRTMVLTRYFATKIVVDLRDEVAAHLLRLPLRFFGLRRMGDLLSSITNDTQVLSRSFTLACDHVVVDPMLILLNALIIVVAAPQLSWVLVLMIPVMAIPLLRQARKVRRRSSRTLAAMGDATESLNQMLSGIKTVKAFQLETRRLEEFRESNARYLHRTKRMLEAKAAGQGMVFVAYNIGFAAMLLGLGWLMVDGAISVSDIGVVLVPIATTYTHVKRLSRAYNTLMESVGALDGIESVMREGVAAGELRQGRPVGRVRGEVEFQDVVFAYENEPVIRGLSFHVRPGEVVALVGPSGAGKSTTIDLLMRFHDPVGGRILIDGVDLREMDLGAYRQHLAVVTQQPFLFNTTIAENIRFGRPGASDGEIREAARLAQIDDFVMALPDGYDSLVGERGAKLSGGQMQRITIARAIVRDAALLFLDEATSALDSESEEAVQKALVNLMQGRTSFVIAHRLSTVRNADRILVLDSGRLVESGRHDDLVAGEGLYRRMSELQQLT